MDKCVCEKLFHTMRNCKQPITSNGIIHVHDGKYLMICRKKSLGYVDFISGKYSLVSVQHLRNLVDEMTMEEKRNIMEWTFVRLSNDLWGGGMVEQHAFEKFTTLKTGVLIEDKWVCLAALVEESQTKWETPEWGFPKGRRHVNESDLACALREYEEETGYSRKNVQLITNLMPYEEVFIGSNYKAYKHKYYVAFNVRKNPDTVVYCNEVSEMRLFTYEEAMEAIRPYNIERKNVLTRVDHMLKAFFSARAYNVTDELEDLRGISQKTQNVLA